MAESKLPKNPELNVSRNAEIIEPEVLPPESEPIQMQAQPQQQPAETPAKNSTEPISRKRLIAALAGAIASDLIAIPFHFIFPPGEIVVDVITAGLLAWIFRGFDLIMVLAFVLELPPIISLLPWWTLIAIARWKGWEASSAFKLISGIVSRFKGK